MPMTDALFLLAEGREHPMHVGGLHLYQPPEDAGPDYVAEQYRRSIEHGDIMRRLRRRPIRRFAGLGPWEWQDDPDLDLEYHLRHSALPRPGRVRELLGLVSRLHGTLLDRSRPLWESHVIEGLTDGRFATYTKIHHALVDGVSAMRLLERSLSPDPAATDMPPPLSERDSSRNRDDRQADRNPVHLAGSLIASGLDAAKGAVGASESAVRSLVRSFTEEAATFPFQAPPTMLNVPITGARRFAADSWRMERLKAVAKTLGGTVNDVVLAMSGGALRHYLLDHGALPYDPLVAMVPVSLRTDDDDEESGNLVGVILCNLGTHLEDPFKRFDVVHESAEIGKMQLKGLNQMGALMLSALSVGSLGLGPVYRFERLRRPPFNIVISNVPGPTQPLYWNGARLDGAYPASIPIDGQALNITCASYADQMCFGLVGCRRSAPSLQRLLEHLETSLEELESVT
ncbi:MAG: wax ester/triacylglycerol synthase family O-acyltransferase [Nitriliruptorales bacterium]|nr:wax ester/triacylglycerol synthase family O-acyltransferase [Nitriliruptorales bacterium]